jgi:hypothetical protein
MIEDQEIYAIIQTAVRRASGGNFWIQPLQDATMGIKQLIGKAYAKGLEDGRAAPDISRHFPTIGDKRNEQ